MSVVIDCHCHAVRGAGAQGQLLKRYLRRAAAAGIERTVLFANLEQDYAAANEHVADLVRTSQGRLHGFAFVHAGRDRGRIRSMVERAVTVHGFCGIKVHRHDAPISAEVCEAAREFAVPILYDIMGHVQEVDTLANSCPDVSFIVPHLGAFADDQSVQVAFISRLARYPNVYTDSSGVRFFDMLRRAVEHAGPQKLLFGSDGPWLHPGLELEKIRMLNLPRSDEQLVLARNWLTITARVRATH